MKEKQWRVEEPGELLPFLLGAGTGLSRNGVKSLLTGGGVLVDGVRARRHDTPLHPGQIVSLAPRVRGAELPFPVIYEDEWLIAVDKPAGLLSVAADAQRERTAYRAVNDYVHAVSGGRIFVVHRLDRDTSGVLLFAKSEAVKRALQDNWDARVRRRGYTAAVEGVPAPEEGTVRSFLKETSAHRVYSAPSGGKPAVTHYRTMSKGRGYAVLDVAIDTGRKNQIRVHMADLGCPVAGDKKYGAGTNPLGRLCLHAGELRLTHPVSGEELSLISSAPASFFRLCGPKKRPGHHADK